MSLKVYIALAVSVVSLGVAIISWSWPMLINAVVAYWLASEFAYDEIMRYMK